MVRSTISLKKAFSHAFTHFFSFLWRAISRAFVNLLLPGALTVGIIYLAVGRFTSADELMGALKTFLLTREITTTTFVALLVYIFFMLFWGMGIARMQYELALNALDKKESRWWFLNHFKPGARIISATAIISALYGLIWKIFFAVFASVMSVKTVLALSTIVALCISVFFFYFPFFVVDKVMGVFASIGSSIRSIPWTLWFVAAVWMSGTYILPFYLSSTVIRLVITIINIFFFLVLAACYRQQYPIPEQRI
ncbi:MAG: hypothetical protein JW725_04670 [Candidatus Babeliaceae bacterium]|nr:hypothetical protein [Candidatus Babeliaceae bacterium]